MQTKQQIQKILASVGASPDKKLGQNFLIDTNLVKFLIEKAAITKQDIVFEIGCGTGTLTESLAQLAGAVVVVEYDKLLSLVAKQLFADKADVIVINGDALNGKNAINAQAAELISDYQNKLNGRTLLVANLPYNIAASAMMNLMLSKPYVDAMYVTVQKEVAQRMASLPGGELYGTLSVIAGAMGEVKILRKLPPNVFWPPPNVDSAMVEFVRDEQKARKIDDIDIFKAVVSLFMGHRRKMLKGCTKFAQGRLADVKDWDSVFAKAGINPQLRAENLFAEQFVSLSNEIVSA